MIEAWESRLFPDIYDKVVPADRVKYGVLNAVNDPPGAQWVACESMLCPTFLVTKARYHVSRKAVWTGPPFDRCGRPVCQCYIQTSSWRLMGYDGRWRECLALAKDFEGLLGVARSPAAYHLL